MSRWRRVPAGLGAALLLLLTTVGGVAGAVPLPERAARAARATAGHVPDAAGRPDGPDPHVTPGPDRALVTVTDVSPFVTGPGTTVTITGTVTAPRDRALRGARLRVVRGPSGLTRHDAVAAWARQTGPARGSTVARAGLPTVEAAGSTGFSVQVPSGRVGSSLPFAAIPISIEVVPREAGGPVGVLRTFLAWQARKEYVPLEIATVLPVTLPPDPALFSGPEDARIRAWRAAIGPGSRVRDLLDGSAGHEVTLAVDPSVFGPSAVGASAPTAPTPGPTGSEPATTGPPADGSALPTAPAPGAAPPSTPGSTAAPTPTPAPTIAGRVVAGLGDEVAEALKDRTVWALPYADADLAAAAAIDPSNAIIRGLVDRSAIVGSRLGRPVRADVVLPADGLAPPAREQALLTLLQGTRVGRPAGIVVNSAAISRTAAYTPSARRVSAAGTRLLGWDPTLSALLPAGPDAGVAARQRFLAETLALLWERPGTERSVLVLGARTLNPDPVGLGDLLDAIDAAPWLIPVRADTLLVDSGSDVATRVETPAGPVAPAAPKPTLTGPRLQRMATERDTLHEVATVLRDGPSFEAAYQEVLDELASTRWRWDRAGWTRLEASVTADVKAATSAIRVVPRSFNFLAEQGTLTLTVENGLGYAVADIRLVLTPTNPRMQIIAQPGPIRIGAASKTSVKVAVRAVAAGQADIRAALTTADGTPIGRPAVIPVTANPLDRTIYWAVGILAALVLIAGVARSLLRGTSRLEQIGNPPDPDTDSHGQQHGSRGRST
ncbi:DUF6049 family protein [Intrasporangium sp.]|uniref:DUF6049 family protein n=1 Tax=Intrasporangium sp. TaxID=1925024 RepID=UPI003221AC9C